MISYKIKKSRVEHLFRTPEIYTAANHRVRGNSTLSHHLPNGPENVFIKGMIKGMMIMKNLLF